MRATITILQIIVSTLLVGVIITQSRGKGFIRSWGGSSSFTRRGLERVIFKATFVIVALFIILSILQLVI